MCITNALFLRDRNEQSPSPRPCPSIPGGRPAPEFRLLPPAPSQAAVPVRSPQLGPGLHPIEPPGPPPQNPVRGLRLLLSITPRSSVPFPSNPQLRSSSRSPPPAYPSPQAPAPLLRPQPPSQPPPGNAGSETEGLPYPALAPVVFFYLTQESRPRSWCLRMLVFLDLAPTWFERVSMLVILLNCVTLGMFQPCEDIACDSQRCRILQGFDDFIFAFFAVEMIVKMVALGIFGKKCYLGDTWNRLDFFIVIAGMLEYSLDLQNVSLSAVRTVRVLRPLRAINRVPSMRILVTLLLDTLPMLGNVLLLCFFVFFIFGIVGVQLWAGLLRNRCFLPENFSLPLTVDLERYYQTENEDESPFICSQPRENGMRSCRSVPLLREEGLPCSLDLGAYNSSTNTTCVNWNQYYTNCSAGEHNPFKGAINFDNIGYAWIAIFQVITLEGWVDIMYFVMDAHSFYNFIYFILLIIVGSFFMINLCLVVIATQFSETKQRESQLMKEQRARFLSNASTLASFSEPGSCYEELLKYVVYVLRKGARRLAEVSRLLASPGGRPGPETPAGAEGETAGRSGRRPRAPHPHQSQHPARLLRQRTRGRTGRRGAEGAGAGGIQRSHGDSPQSALGVFSQDPQAGDGRGRPRARRPSRPLALWALVCETFRKIVDSKYFGRGIMIAILVNTLSMGVEYHEQPEELTNALEISNIVFTSLFALEMLLKILVYGPFGYIKNPYNIFDGIIVVISVWEIVGQQGGGLSVLRTFRLMRVLKLVRFMPALQRQLVVLMKTMDNVATFCMLLMLFIFIFSILGMHLFGCKFASERDGDTLPDRKNFDSLLWAIVTVFQILTQEDWNKVLYNGMASTSSWAALYFIALMTFGNYVLFNLLVAILVEGFQTEVPPPALPWGGNRDPRGLRGGGRSRGPASSTVCRRLPSARSSPHSPWSSAGSWTSRRSSWNSLGRAPSLKRRSQSGERRSLLSGDGQESLDEGESSDEEPSSRAGSVRGGPRLGSLEAKGSGDLQDTLQVPALYRTASTASGRTVSSEHQDCNGKTAAGVQARQQRPEEPRPDGDEGDDEDNMRVRAWIGARLPACCRERDSWSAFIFPPQSRFRLMCHRTITHKMFDHIVLVIIFLNCITIAMERPKIDPHSAERIFLTLSNYIFTVIFLAEMTVKVVALGWCFGERAYLKSSWNVLDGVLVLISVIDILVSLVSDSGTKILGMLRVLRLLRTLRPLRVISRAQGLKLVVETLMSSLKPIGNIVVICCAFFIIFGILGVQLFKGKFFVCQGEDTRNITNKSDCAEASYRWVRHKYNFDNLGQALMSLFVLASKDGWVDIMYDGLDAVGVDQQPVMNYNPWMLLYFISFLLIVAFFVLNMFVGVVVENFHKCRQHQEEEEARRREEKRLRRLEKKRRKAQCKPYYSDYSRFRLLVHQLCTSHYLDLFITGVIGLNVITMAMEHYQQPKVLDEALKICNYIFTVIFVLESVFKLMAFGFRRFFQDRWNQLDLAIVLLSIMGITLEEIEVNASLPINPTIIRIMRVLRIARGESSLAFGRPTAAPVSLLLFQVGNLGLLFMLLFFIFAALGVELFGDLECDDTHLCEGLGRHATFRNFGMAFLTLFRVSTGDNWNGIMKDTLRDCDQESTCYNTVISPIYFVSFVLTAQFVLVNVVIAVLMKHLEESNKQAKEEAELEAELELEMKTVGPLPPPLPPPPHSVIARPGPLPTPSLLSRTTVLSENPVFSLPLRFLSLPHSNPDLALSLSSWAASTAAARRLSQERHLFDTISLLIQGSLEGELKQMDSLSDSVCPHYALAASHRCSSEEQVNFPPFWLGLRP
uniref:Voltage-dependent T-type calcium channel subunit alpha n=1 Tax=Ornithorhynchus anatinus TaxID=9258 RepID=A0A6I8P166_ORNAN